MFIILHFILFFKFKNSTYRTSFSNNLNNLLEKLSNSNSSAILQFRYFASLKTSFRNYFSNLELCN